MNRTGNRKKPIAWVMDGGCIRCTSHRGMDGVRYPRIERNGVQYLISRLILSRRIGKLPPGIEARHTCDNNWCIRPDHIIQGTHTDNMRDMISRGRHNPAKGEANGYSKLNEQQVREIKASTGKQRDVARQYGVTQYCIWAIRAGRSWRHVQ